MGDCCTLVFQQPEKSNIIYTHKKFKKSAPVVDTTNNQRGGGYNYTTSSSCTSTTTLNQPPSPCQDRQKRRRVAVSPAPQRNSTPVRPIPIRKESGLVLGGGFRLTVKQEGSGTLPSLKLKDVQHLKERSPTVEYPPALDDRLEANSHAPLTSKHQVSDYPREAGPPNITIGPSPYLIPVQITNNPLQFSNPHLSPQPQPQASPTQLQPRQQPPPPQPQPLSLIKKPVPQRMIPAAASPLGNDVLPNIPGLVVSNEPLDLTVKKDQVQVPSRKTQKRSRGDSSDKKGKHAKIEDLVPQYLLDKLGLRTYEQLKLIETKPLNAILNKSGLDKDERNRVKKARRCYKNRGYSSNKRKKEQKLEGEMKEQIAEWNTMIAEYNKHASNKEEASEIITAILQELQEKMNLKYVWSDEKNKNGDVKGWTLEPLLNNKEH